MNDERPIEKLLRRHAKQRADEAAARGAPMHPATRRMLQGEVARQFPGKAGPEKGRLARLFSEGIGRLAYAASGIAVMLVIGLMFVPGLMKPKQDAQLASTSVERELAKQPVDELGILENAPALEKKSASETAADWNDDSRSAGVRTAAATTPAAVPVLAERQNRPAIREESTRADTRFATDLPKDRAVLSSSALGSAAATPQGIVSPPPAVVASPKAESASTAFGLALADGKSGQAQENRYYQIFSNTGVAMRRAQRVATQNEPRQDVLSNFRVEQQGERLVVIDADGSAYVGEMARSDHPGFDRAKGVETDAFRQRPGSPAPETAALNYTWRAVGTNRTLRQQVEFNWNFLALTNPVVSVSGEKFSRTPTPELKASQALSLDVIQNSAINGRLRVNAGKEIEINAVPVAP